MTDEQNERAARVWREAGGTWPGGQAKEVLDDFRAAFASRDETYWLIERRTSPPQWTKGHPATFGDLTADVHQAMRYATEHQALDALRMMPSLPEVRAEFFACEHMWVEPPSARITGDKDRSVQSRAPTDLTTRIQSEAELIEKLARAIRERLEVEWYDTHGNDATICKDSIYNATRAALNTLRETLVPVGWMYHYPGELEHGFHRYQPYEGMSCNEEDAGIIETPLYALPQEEKHDAR